MKIRFEQWMTDSNLKTSELKLFSEAVICYKANAYRAALLLTFIGFIEIIRSRLLQAKKPNLVQAGEWENKRRDVMNDDTSDKTIIDLLNRTDKKYFKLTDTLRTQISYWKDRRNDCAHLKGSEITSSHVESFWLFLMDNINKISVSDSDTDLLNQFRFHFDDTHTPYNTDVTPLILKIPASVEICDFYAFLEQFVEVMNEAEAVDLFSLIGEREKCFLLMLDNLPNQYGEIVKTYILQHGEIAKGMYAWQPKYLVYFSDDPKFIRASWKQGLKTYFSITAATVLLRNNLIPKSEIPEFIQEHANNITDYTPKDEDLNFLGHFGFDDQLLKILNDALTKELHYEWWINQNPRFIKYYLNRCLQTKNNDLIDMIIKSYTSDYRDEKANKVYSIIASIVSENATYRDYIKERADQLGITIDSYFVF